MDLCCQSNISAFNILSRLVITFLPRSKYLLISWLKPLSAVIVEPPKNKVWHCFHCLSLSSRGFLVPLHFLPYGWCHLHIRLLIFLPAILIPACVSSSPAFFMMYSACKLNKQGDNIQPWRTPFPIWNQSVVPCRYYTKWSRSVMSLCDPTDCNIPVSSVHGIFQARVLE